MTDSVLSVVVHQGIYCRMTIGQSNRHYDIVDCDRRTDWRVTNATHANSTRHACLFALISWFIGDMSPQWLYCGVRRCRRRRCRRL